jgi:hypothetical protein
MRQAVDDILLVGVDDPVALGATGWTKHHPAGLAD